MISFREVMNVRRHSWLQLDDQRTTWLFLVLGEHPEETSEASTTVSREGLEYWELGVGNPNTLVRAEAEKVGVGGISSESDLLESLLVELRPHRYQGTVLIIPDRATLQTLRRSFGDTPLQGATLRGLSYIELEASLRSAFGQSLAEHRLDAGSYVSPRVTEGDTEAVVSAGTVERFWDLWTRVFPLVPAADLQGEAL
ncbi:hypothetical protein [Halobacterium rubrum]|uniref:hypothetical protein n=1 Tax=Halobacterium TaxID=2239 RepID=UPI001F2653BA|nr:MULTISPECIES: hypothetical protein [Halobacterium]MDH5020367.1 hypothetical protein [Halobacterium rubrum]